MQHFIYPAILKSVHLTFNFILILFLHKMYIGNIGITKILWYLEEINQ